MCGTPGSTGAPPLKTESAASPTTPARKQITSAWERWCPTEGKCPGPCDPNWRYPASPKIYWTIWRDVRSSKTQMDEPIAAQPQPKAEDYLGNRARLAPVATASYVPGVDFEAQIPRDDSKRRASCGAHARSSRLRQSCGRFAASTRVAQIARRSGPRQGQEMVAKPRVPSALR